MRIPGVGVIFEGGQSVDGVRFVGFLGQGLGCVFFLGLLVFSLRGEERGFFVGMSFTWMQSV